MTTKFFISVCAGIVLTGNILLNAQNNNSHSFDRDSLLFAAREIVESVGYCGLVTIDTNGMPQVRTMNPFPHEDNWEIWFATNRASGKVQEILRNENVSVYFADLTSAKGYVTITGKATIIDDKDLLISKKREYWEKYIPDWLDVFVLIKITPSSFKVINYKHNINGNPDTYGAPTVEF